MTSNFGKKLLFARVILFIVKHQDKQRENKLIFNILVEAHANKIILIYVESLYFFITYCRKYK
jgi:hypothetical protein